MNLNESARRGKKNLVVHPPVGSSDPCVFVSDRTRDRDGSWTSAHRLSFAPAASGASGVKSLGPSGRPPSLVSSTWTFCVKISTMSRKFSSLWSTAEVFRTGQWKLLWKKNPKKHEFGPWGQQKTFYLVSVWNKMHKSPFSPYPCSLLMLSGANRSKKSRIHR